MGRAITISLLLGLITGAVSAQPADAVGESRTVLRDGNQKLSAGAISIRAGNYDEGIRQTLSGLDAPDLSNELRAAALSNLCAAYAAKNQPDTAIRYCTESLGLDASNWRAFSNRSYAYWIKGLYSEAAIDLDAAAAMSPRARQVAMIRGMINEARLEPHIRIEDLH